MVKQLIFAEKCATITVNNAKIWSLGGEKDQPGNGDSMDRRDEELKFLKKAYHREKRGATAVWKLLFAVTLILCLVLVPLGLQVIFSGSTMADYIGEGIRIAEEYLPVLGSIRIQLMAWTNILFILLGITLLVWLLSVIMWSVGSRKLKRTDAFLSYWTLREALREEKKYQE